MTIVFWFCLLCSSYAYIGYPFALLAVSSLLGRTRGERMAADDSLPSVTMLVPVHNEARVIRNKLENTLALDYSGSLTAVFISDGSTDATVEQLRSFAQEPRLRFIELHERKGKANALNTGLGAATGEIVVFSDASIMLDPKAIREIVRPFEDPQIGCASGEDYIEGTAGEGLYGRYELYLRSLESRIGSIVGASGSFYAQRRELVDDFAEGLAPDFLSVLSTVEKGYRAVSVPSAFGYMKALSATSDEFRRKVRTLVRGMTALFSRKRLLNPFRYPVFAFSLWSHKLMRWFVPLFLIGLLMSSALLADILFYRLALIAQLVFYFLAGLAYLNVRTVADSVAGRIALYFVAVNMAILVAWLLYCSGVRQEVWAPTKRVS